MSKVMISELVLRDAHQSLLATRMLLADMLPVAPKLDRVGYWSLETWGGATFDSCIRYLNEDPWERIRRLKAAMPHTPMQMLLRGQNLLGYRHYADDVVEAFVERAAANGVDVFRVFDALNDVRNLATAMRAVRKQGKHAQACISYTLSPVHTPETYAALGEQLKGLGADSICIKDMAGLLRPYEAEALVRSLKQRTGLPINVHSHATTGLSVATLLKSVEAGAEMLDTTISSLSMGTSHSPTETIVEALRGTAWDTGLDVKRLVEIAAYFRDVRRKYKRFESEFIGADTRILVAQVPGGMLSNLESQLREQKAAHRVNDVLDEISVVQKDFGYPPLVTPTSQIVGTQAVLNVLFGRYKQLTAESRSLLVGRYGRTPATPNAELVERALKDLGLAKAITHRPADDLPNELGRIEEELKGKLGKNSVPMEDVLTYAMFPQVALPFFGTRARGAVTFDEPAPAAQPEAAKPAPAAAAASAPRGPASYVITVDGQDYQVTVRGAGTAPAAAPAQAASAQPAPAKPATAAPAGGNGHHAIEAPVAGNVLRLSLADGDAVAHGQPVLILEAMKMEFTVNSGAHGKLRYRVKPGDSVQAGQLLAEIAGNGAAS